ncbi:MAG: ABC transporter ATP-binding protein, partial [Candidatus Aenigmarchaeota archaeon]|nr:ABC transporter ATP-binding protein [Candidatus Aenigmarchaeota archaeon]
MKNIIVVSNISKSYKKDKGIFKRKEYKKAIDNISFSVKKGEIFGLLGPNGAGKTTLIKILTGMLEADKGSVFVLGKMLPNEADKIKERINGIFARANMFWQLTGKENLGVYANIYNIRNKKKIINKYIKFFELQDVANQPIFKCSTGENMRFNLARSLLNNPEILFLDEPTLGIDPRMALKIRQFIKKLNKVEKNTIILTTHYMEEADYLCDRIAIINKGKIIKIDTPENLRKLFKKEAILEIRLQKTNI